MCLFVSLVVGYWRRWGRRRWGQEKSVQCVSVCVVLEEEEGVNISVERRTKEGEGETQERSRLATLYHLPYHTYLPTSSSPLVFLRRRRFSGVSDSFSVPAVRVNDQTRCEFQILVIRAWVELSSVWVGVGGSSRVEFSLSRVFQASLFSLSFSASASAQQAGSYTDRKLAENLLLSLAFSSLNVCTFGGTYTKFMFVHSQIAP